MSFNRQHLSCLRFLRDHLSSIPKPTNIANNGIATKRNIHTRPQVANQIVLSPSYTTIIKGHQYASTIYTGKPPGGSQQRPFSTTNGGGQSWQTNNGSQSTSDDKYKTILVTRPEKHVLGIELNNPKSKNAFSLETAKEFLELFNELEANQSIRCVILSGSGPDFTSGVDLKSFMGVYSSLQQTEDVAHRAKLLRQVVEQFQAPFKRMYSFSKPIISVCHGLSLGLGIELAACSDIRFCTRDVKLAIREVLIGIAADVGSLQLLPRLASNQSLLNELIYTGRYLTPDEALSLGFVSRICPSKAEAMDEALELAKTIGQRSPVAVQGSKQNIRFSADKPFMVGLDYNAVWNAAMMQGDDVVTAIGAILSKSQQVDYKNF